MRVVWEWVAWECGGVWGIGGVRISAHRDSGVRGFAHLESTGVHFCAQNSPEFPWQKHPKSAVLCTKIQVRVVCPKWPDKKYRQKGQKAAEKPGFDPLPREPPKWPKSAGPPLRTPPKSAY